MYVPFEGTRCEFTGYGVRGSAVSSEPICIYRVFYVSVVKVSHKKIMVKFYFSFIAREASFSQNKKCWILRQYLHEERKNCIVFSKNGKGRRQRPGIFSLRNSYLTRRIVGFNSLFSLTYLSLKYSKTYFNIP